MNNEYNLTTNILSLSQSKDWNEAKTEWKFIDAFQREDSECLCGKKGIKNVCVIMNINNDNITEVGNCCVKKFLNINEGAMYFTNLNKLNKNIKSNVSLYFLWMLLDSNFISKDEYTLYVKFTDQNEKKTSQDWLDKVDINKKILSRYVINKPPGNQ